MGDTFYRGVVCTALGPPEVLKLQQLPRGEILPGTVRVKIKAAGINFPDLLMIEGKYQHRPELPFVPGLEAAGLVIETAPDVPASMIGQRVIVRMSTGGYAEEAVVPVNQTIPLPTNFSFAEGATFLVAHLTAYHALVTRAALAPTQTLLVLGAAGGVGLAAVQIGKVLGAVVIAAASTDAKLRRASAVGADHVINYGEEPVEKRVSRLTSAAGVDVIFDPVGIAQEAALRCLAYEGKLLIAGFAAGALPAYAANRILLKGCSVIGIRAGEAGRRNPQMRADELDALFSLAARGLARPTVSASFALHRYAEAMHLLASRQAIGRVALTVNEP